MEKGESEGHSTSFCGHLTSPVPREQTVLNARAPHMSLCNGKHVTKYPDKKVRNEYEYSCARNYTQRYSSREKIVQHDSAHTVTTVMKSNKPDVFRK